MTLQMTNLEIIKEARLILHETDCDKNNELNLCKKLSAVDVDKISSALFIARVLEENRLIKENPVHSAGVCCCGECKRWQPDGGYGHDLDGTKRLYGECSITHYPSRETHFCSYGVRK